MLYLPDLIGRRIDIEDRPPGAPPHSGRGMECVLWAVHVKDDGFVWAESTEGMGWGICSTTIVTLLDPDEDEEEMAWRQELEANR